MSRPVFGPGVYAIYDHPHRGRVPAGDAVRAMLAGGIRCIQLRAKGANTAERLALLRRMGPSCARTGCGLWVNDDLDAALAGIEGVTGLHLGQEDLAEVEPARFAEIRRRGVLLGVSTHDDAQVLAAGKYEPDYIAFGPIYPTTGKDNPDPVVGVDRLRAAARQTTRPVVAIGGINVQRAPDCIAAGASAVAIIGALVDQNAAGIEARSRALVEACRAALPTP